MGCIAEAILSIFLDRSFSSEGRRGDVRIIFNTSLHFYQLVNFYSTLSHLSIFSAIKILRFQ